MAITCTMYASGEKRTLSVRDMSHFPDSNRILTVGKSFLADMCSGVDPTYSVWMYKMPQVDCKLSIASN